MTLAFQAGRIIGTDGCNRFSGPYTVVGNHLKIGPEVISTQMGCPSEVMRLASTYMSALLSAKGFHMDKGRLELIDAADTVLAAFVAPAKLK